MSGPQLWPSGSSGFPAWNIAGPAWHPVSSGFAQGRTARCSGGHAEVPRHEVVLHAGAAAEADERGARAVDALARNQRDPFHPESVGGEVDVLRRDDLAAVE